MKFNYFGEFPTSIENHNYNTVPISWTVVTYYCEFLSDSKISVAV